MSSRTDEPAGEPRTVDEARDAVERSRQRISSTLDALEDRIVEKKHELQEKVDVLRPVREQIVARPFTAIAIGVGVGALLGSLGGGDDDEDAHEHRSSGRVRGALSDEERRELRAWRRARRDRLRSARSEHGEDEEESRFAGLRFDALRHQLMGAVTSALTAAVTKKVRQYAMDTIGGGNGQRGRDSRQRDRSDSRDVHVSQESSRADPERY